MRFTVNAGIRRHGFTANGLLALYFYYLNKHKYFTYEKSVET